MRTFLLLAMMWVLAGCADTSDGPRWGDGFSLAPGWARVKTAAVDAATSPATWVPVAGALAFQIGNADRGLAGWASDHHPLFGSRATADDAGDVLRAIAGASWVATGLAAPAPEGQWLDSKLEGFGVGTAAIGVTAGVTEVLKTTVDRNRPKGRGGKSFPSGHSSLTAVAARLSQRNLEYDNVTPGARLGLDIGLAGLTATTAWSRLEAGKHHPSDVLAGIALGNFFGIFFNDAFLGRAADVRPHMQLETAPHGAVLSFNVPLD